VNDNAVAYQFDVDKDEALAKQFKIEAMPTVIILKDGKEFDRIIGLKPGPEFLAWLEGVAVGESKLDQALKAVQEERAKGDSGANYSKRLALAGDLYDYGSYDEATTEAAWLWEHASGDREPGMLSSLMADLARRHAPAKARFTAFRDAAAKPVLAGKPTQNELTTWLTLNAVVGDAQTTVDWALKMTDTPENLAALRSVGGTVFPLLVQGGHWETAGKSLANPVAEVNTRGSQLGAYDMPIIAAGSGKPGVIPAIPLMRKGAASTADTATDNAAKTVPAIPLMRKGAPAADAPDQAKSVPAIPLMRKGEPAAATPPSANEAKTIPAIPLMRKGDAVQNDANPKVLPAMPLMRKGSDDATTHEGEIDIPAMGAPGGFDRNDPATVAREVRYRLTLEFRDMAATYYAACLAAGRDAEASQIAELTFRYTDTPASRLLLAQRALKAGKPQPEHLTWMDEIEAAGKAASLLRTRLDGAAKR
jgi:hypothetical protein